MKAQQINDGDPPRQGLHAGDNVPHFSNLKHLISLIAGNYLLDFWHEQAFNPFRLGN
jgi:hypothetical protein